jgi:hypothetical protein
MKLNAFIKMTLMNCNNMLEKGAFYQVEFKVSNSSDGAQGCENDTLAMEQYVLDTNAGKQLSKVATDF